MIVVLIVSVVVIAGLVIALAVARGGPSIHMSPVTSAAGGVMLPEGALTSSDVARVRFDRCLRGYRMDQVDDVLDRLRAELAERDSELRDLRDQPSWQGPGWGGPGPSPTRGPGGTR